MIIYIEEIFNGEKTIRRFYEFGAFVDYISTDVINDTWNKEFHIHTAPTMEWPNLEASVRRHVHKAHLAGNRKVYMGA